MKSNSGNVLVFILIAVFLLGALTAVFVRSSGTSEETGSTERLTVKASELIRYAATIKNTINNALLNGCSRNQISLKNNLSTSYNNPNSPTDGSCSVFTDDKGPVNYINTKTAGFQTQSGTGYLASTYFTASPMAHPDAGAMLPDLMMFVAGLDKSLCMKINNIVGMTNPSGDAPDCLTKSLGGVSFQGSFGTGGVPGGSNRLISCTGGETDNHLTGCVHMQLDGGTVVYSFYSVLVPQ